MPYTSVYWTQETKENVQAAAAAMGMSVNRYIMLALDSFGEGVDVPEQNDLNQVTGEKRQISLYLTEHMIDMLNTWAIDNNMRSLSRAIRQILAESIGVAESPQIEKVKRDRRLTQDVIIEEHVEQFNEMKSAPKVVSIWEEILDADPDGVPSNKVFDCEVPGCKLDHADWHKHQNKELAPLARRKLGIDSSPPGD